MTIAIKGHLKAVMFDLDGTLVDTTYLHTVTWWQALTEHDHIVPMARIHRAIGMGSDELLRQVLGADHDTEQDPYISAAHDYHFRGWHPAAKPFPGARELLRRCRDAGLVVVLATSAKAHDLQALREVLDADDAIDLATSSEDATQSKPSPDILTVALTKAGLRPDEVVYVGDAVWDVKASAALQIPCISLECGGTSAAELRGAGAFETWRDPADLLDNFKRSLLSLGSSINRRPPRPGVKKRQNA